MMGLPTPQPWL